MVPVGWGASRKLVAPCASAVRSMGPRACRGMFTCKGERGAAWAQQEGQHCPFIRVLQVEGLLSSPGRAAAWYFGPGKGGGTPDRAGAMLPRRGAPTWGCFPQGPWSLRGHSKLSLGQVAGQFLLGTWGGVG